MTIVQVNSGTVANATSFNVTTTTAVSASNRLVVFVAGNTLVNTPSGWTLRPGQQVNDMGHYLYDRAGDGSTTSWGFTNSSGDLTWVALEIQGGTYVSGSGQNAPSASATYSTTSNTPTAGTRVVLASLGSLFGSGVVRTVSGWTNSFVEQADLCVADSDYPMQGVAALDNITANGSTAYSTTATYSSSNPSRSALIASYATTSGSALTASPTDTAGITDSVTADLTTGGASLTATPADTAGITDSAATTVARAVTVNDSVGITDTGGPQQIDIGLTLAETIGVTDAASSTSARALTVSDNVGLLDAAATAAARVAAVADSVGTTDATQADKGQLSSVADTVGITDAAGTVADRATAPADTAGLTDTVDVVAVRLLTVTDTAGITDSVSADLTVGGNNLTANISDTIGILDSAATVAVRAVTVTDTVDVVDVATTAATRVLTITDTAGITDAADGQLTIGGNALTADISDSIGITDTAGHVSARVLDIAELVGVTDAVDLTKVWTVTVSDTVSVLDSVSAPGPFKDYTITVGRAVLGDPKRRSGVLGDPTRRTGRGTW